MLCGSYKHYFRKYLYNHFLSLLAKLEPYVMKKKAWEIVYQQKLKPVNMPEDYYYFFFYTLHYSNHQTTDMYNDMIIYAVTVLPFCIYVAVSIFTITDLYLIWTTSHAFHYPQEPDLTKLEKAINAGQIEEVIVQAEKELSLARKMLEWKAWEPLVQDPPKGQWQWPIK